MDMENDIPSFLIPIYKPLCSGKVLWSHGDVTAGIKLSAEPVQWKIKRINLLLISLVNYQ